MSISEETPSTSQADTEGDEGLTAAAKRKKKKEEKKAALVSLQAKKSDEPKPVVSEAPETSSMVVEPGPSPPAPVTKMEVVEEEGGLGLGGGGRKRQKKKPKEAKAAQPTQSTIPPGTDASAPPGAGPQPTSSSAQQPASVALPQTPSQPAAPAWGQGPTSLPSSSSFPPSGVIKSAGRGSGFPSAAAPSTSRGRGQPAGDSAQPGPSQAPVSYSAPVPTPATPKPAAQPEAADTSLSRFKIPKKIEGGLIPHTKVNVLTNYLAMKIQPLKIVSLFIRGLFLLNSLLYDSGSHLVVRVPTLTIKMTLISKLIITQTFAEIYV